MKCTLLVGQKTQSWMSREEKVVFSGNYNSTNLFFSSVKKAKQAAALADVDCFRVMEVSGEYDRYNYSDDPLYETADITAYWKKSKKDKEDRDKDMNRKVEAINKLSDILDVTELKLENGSVVKIVFTKGEYLYNRALSHNLRGYVKVIIKREGRVVRDMFWASDYIKRDGRVMIKKFKEDFYYKFGVNVEDMPEDFDYKKFLVDIQKGQKSWEKKLRDI